MLRLDKNLACDQRASKACQSLHVRCTEPIQSSTLGRCSCCVDAPIACQNIIRGVVQNVRNPISRRRSEGHTNQEEDMRSFTPPEVIPPSMKTLPSNLPRQIHFHPHLQMEMKWFAFIKTLYTHLMVQRFGGLTRAKSWKKSRFFPTRISFVCLTIFTILSAFVLNSDQGIILLQNKLYKSIT